MDHKKSKIVLSFKDVNRKLIYIVLILLVIFFITQILSTSVVGSKSSEIELIRITKDTVRLENEILNSQINQQKSLEKILSGVKKDDFVEKNVNVLREQSSNVATNLNE